MQEVVVVDEEEITLPKYCTHSFADWLLMLPRRNRSSSNSSSRRVAPKSSRIHVSFFCAIASVDERVGSHASRVKQCRFRSLI